ncbi:hypothetical protein BYT27DRAFT_7152960 [Phlegmacium glaucopus]|nr:hypothetical protein BYT27DRAFT_7152960 [Phlegmacium glaucopus]
MEHSLCSQRQKSQNALPSSLTVDSLDLRQLLASDHIQPLISESVTFDTLSSSSSDQVPPFYAFKTPRLSIIGLGDHLKMFSGPLSQLQEPRTDVNPKVVITSPTSPRLKSMFKECLCISKWAECLTGWRAPGHIPWGNTPDQAPVSEKWLPEGSLYSPEDFSRALLQARAGHVRVEVAVAQTKQEPHAFVDASLDKYTTTTERTDFGSCSGTLTHMELVDMVRDLKDMKNFFEGTSQELTLPSLMISNSHCTLPLSLDSYQSFTLKPAANLADRRGRKPLPPLLLKNETMPSELSYPSIPTAFLGSPSTYSPKFQDVNLANQSELCIEDMINNLRLQCSSMALHTPPVDVSCDSRSYTTSLIPAYEPVKPAMEAEVIHFGSTLCPEQPNNTSCEILGRRLATLTAPTGPQKETSLSRARTANLREVGAATKTLQTAKCTRTDAPDKKPEILSKYTSSPPLLLRSSLTKHSTFRPRSLKSVRFALSPSEFEKDVASLMYDDVWRLSQVSAPILPYDKAPVKKNPTPHLNPTSDKERLEGRTRLVRQNTKSWHSTPKASSGMKTKGRIKSIIIKPPLRYSMVPSIFYGNTDKAEIQNNDRIQRSLQSRGRHSLSRIIKGPIFSTKENKRATVSKTWSTRWEFNDDGTAVRDSVTLESIQKKSRMPVPLRNILTRFK